MEHSRFRSVIPKPCACCNGKELDILAVAQASSEDAHWVYELPVQSACTRCDALREDSKRDILFLSCGLSIVLLKLWMPCLVLLFWLGLAWWWWKPRGIRYVKIPIPISTVGTVERAVHAASIATKGSEFRPHGTFIHHLSLSNSTEELKQALCSWAPVAMMGFMEGEKGVRRRLTDGQPKAAADDISVVTTHTGNPDVEEGQMRGTTLQGDEFGPDDRVKAQGALPAQPVLGIQIGPDLIPTEVMESSEGNLKAGISKRVRPLEFRASKKMIRKISKTVDALMKHVFTDEAIKKWREENPDIDEMKSKKWDSERWRQAVNECLSDTHLKIEQEFQIKVNEALPAKGKAPRPIIQCGDKAQVMMQLPVKCFEDLLFHHFEEASIKHTSKYDAMDRAAKRLRQLVKCKLFEGDGAAWDACCNKHIRNLTENRIIEKIITVLGNDPQVPKQWMEATLNDMKKSKIKGKAKVSGKELVPAIRIIIDSIRQSGHRGTSCFNFLINLVCWLCVVAENPEDLIKKVDGKLPETYVSAVDGKTYLLRYIFEGDDSALSTTEDISEEYIIKAWKSLGFNMKLVHVDKKLTFTGNDFLCDDYGPVGPFMPEIPRNIASSSWSCSSILKSHPEKKHEIGMAAMYARADMFKDCGPISKYFAELGLAHARNTDDRAIGDSEAVSLGVHETNSVVTELLHLASSAMPLNDGFRKLVKAVVPDWSEYYETRLLSVDFGTDPFDTNLAREVLPTSLWDPKNFEQARR